MDINHISLSPAMLIDLILLTTVTCVDIKIVKKNKIK